MVENVRATILVTGKVQGVFFRSSALAEAQRLGLSGFVRNLADGSVEAIAEGGRPAVEAFVDWCKLGPSAARVDDVQVKLAAPRDEFRTFTIAR